MSVSVRGTMRRSAVEYRGERTDAFGCIREAMYCGVDADMTLLAAL
jgi:hypothetical protein